MIPPLKPIEPNEFSTWISPAEALASLPSSWTTDAKIRRLHTALKDGLVRAGAARLVWRHAGKRRHASTAMVTRAIWDGWPSNSEDLWETGAISFRAPSAESVDAAPDRRGSKLTTMNAHDVHFHPADVAKLGGSRPSKTPQSSDVPDSKRRGGRPSGSHGEPIARVTLKLAERNEIDLARYTATSLGIELAAEYRSVGLSPPALVNAEKIAAGILRVVREAKGV